MKTRGFLLALMTILSPGISHAGIPNDRFAGLIPLSGWVTNSTIDPTGADTNDADPVASGYEPVSLWWSYTPPADGEVTLSITDLAPPVGATNDPLQNPQGFEVYVYDQIPVASPRATNARGLTNFFDDHWGGLRAGENPKRLNAVDLRFAGKAGATYYIEIGTFQTRTLPFTVKAATSVGTTSWYWGSDHRGGTGYAIEMRGGNVYAGFFIYNDDGTPNWLVASGPLVNGNLFRADLQQYAGGQSIMTAQTPDQAGQVVGSPGTVTITWDGPCHATMIWPGGTVPIECYVFDSGTGWMNSGKPAGYHDTGWYWLPEDGGGRGLFGQAQGSSEYWVIFDYDQHGKATWETVMVGGLPTATGAQPMFGGAANQWESNCMAPVYTDPSSNQNYYYAHPLMSYSGGQSLTGPWKAPTGTVVASIAMTCSSNFFDSASVAGYSTLGGLEFLGPSTSLGGTDLFLSGIADNPSLYDAAQNAVLPPVGGFFLRVFNYPTICSDTGGQCHWTRYQF